VLYEFCNIYLCQKKINVMKNCIILRGIFNNSRKRNARRFRCCFENITVIYKLINIRFIVLFILQYIFVSSIYLKILHFNKKIPFSVLETVCLLPVTQLQYYIIFTIVQCYVLYSREYCTSTLENVHGPTCWTKYFPKYFPNIFLNFLIIQV